MKKIIFKSSVTKLVSTILVPCIFVGFLYLRNTLNNQYVSGAIIAFLVVWIITFISRYVIITCMQDGFSIRKPWDIFFANKVLAVANVKCVEFVSFRGPLLKFTLNNSDSFSFAYASPEKHELEILGAYFKDHQIQTVNF